MLPVLKYTVLRLALFVAALAVFALIGAGGLLSLLGAAVVSLALSFLLLGRQREEMAAVLQERARRRLPRDPGDEAVEDAATQLPPAATRGEVGRSGSAPPHDA